MRQAAASERFTASEGVLSKSLRGLHGMSTRGCLLHTCTMPGGAHVDRQFDGRIVFVVEIDLFSILEGLSTLESSRKMVESQVKVQVRCV